MMLKWSRDYWPSLILAGLIGILTLAGLLEWSWLQTPAHPSASHGDNRQTPNTASGEDEEPSSFELPEMESYTATVERPLFAENRKPPAEEELEAAGNAVSTPLTLKLMGVMLTPRQHAALMQDAKGKYKRLRRNDSLDGWTLVSVASDRVVLQQGGEQKELMLLKPRPKPPASGQMVPKPKVHEGVGDAETEEESDTSDESSGEDTTDEEQDTSE